MATKAIYRGVFPVAPTVFDGNGELDLESQKPRGQAHSAAGDSERTNTG